LVEENVKVGVAHVAEDPVIKAVGSATFLADSQSWEAFRKAQPAVQAQSKRADPAEKPPVAIWIHGFVYDVATGEMIDLKISNGPPGSKLE
jgi:hypothetical protein